ncbi:MAG: hypothetical protein ACRD1T_26085, partial [Acidimicrobiia bacterium]
MNRVPFSVYDFFGILASGFVLLAGTDFAFGGGWILREKMGFVLSLFWVLVAYVAGHVVAGLSGYLYEKKFVRGLLQLPEYTLFRDQGPGGWRRLFSAFYEPLPTRTRAKVLAKAHDRAGLSKPGRDMFFHCLPLVRREPLVLDRLNIFLNLYGFARNSSLAALLIVPVLVIGALTNEAEQGVSAARLWAAAGALVAAVALLYRYLKFFRLYAVEVFVNYAEGE